MAYSGGDAADQMVKMTLEGIEFVARLSGSGAKNLAALSGEKKMKGKARLEQLLRSDKDLKVFSVNKKDEKRFIQMAKKYGIMYCVVQDRKKKDGMTDIIVRGSDAPRINRLIERLKLATVDVAKIEMEMNEKAEPVRDTPAQKSADAFVEELMAKPDKPKEQPTIENPTIRTEKTSPSENSSAPKSTEKQPTNPAAQKPSGSKDAAKPDAQRASVREELADIKTGAGVDGKQPQKEKTAKQQSSGKQKSSGNPPAKTGGGNRKPKTKSTPKKEK